MSSVRRGGIALVALLGAPVALWLGSGPSAGQGGFLDTVKRGEAFACPSPRVTDGDTLRCGERRVRLYGIDSPELPGHCRKGRDCTPGDPWAATDNLNALVADGPLQCEQVDVDRYGRSVALCSAGGVDLSCAQVSAGFAVERYGKLTCN